MKTLTHLGILILLSTVACSPAPSDGSPSADKQPPAPAQAADSGSVKGGVVVGDRVKGKVVETMDASGYTYASVDVGTGKAVWVVGPQTSMSVGNALDIPKGSEMKRFRSKTLNKVFEPIYFVSSFGDAYPPTPRASSGPSSQPTSQPSSRPTQAQKPKAPKEVISIPKAKDGYTVAEIYGKASQLANTSIVVRARVVKFNAGIMGKNWVHLRDGTGDPTAKTHDLTVTSDGTATVGQTVLVRGILATDKDFGAGYKYPVILEQATFTQE